MLLCYSSGQHFDLHSFPYTTLFRSLFAVPPSGRRSPVRPALSAGGAPAADPRVGAPQPQRQAFHDVEHERRRALDRKSTRLNSSHLGISYAVFCLKKKKNLEALLGV